MLTMVLILGLCGICQTGPGIERELSPAIFAAKWYMAGGLLIVLGLMIKSWFSRDERIDSVQSTWGFMKQIFPLLGNRGPGGWVHVGQTPGHPASDPDQYIQGLVGGNSLSAHLFAAVSGALDVLCHADRGAYSSGADRCRHGKRTGPVVAPGWSCPFAPQYAQTIGGVMGAKKTAVFCIIIVILSTIAGMSYGSIAG